jgi:host factor-I protein
METESGGIQNEFFNRARKDRALFAVVLTNGKRLVGRIRAFDKFTVLLDTSGGEQMVFKHAIATVGPANGKDGAADGAGPA